MLCTEHKINKKLCSCPEQKPSQVGVNFIALQQGDQIAEENHCEMGEMQNHEKIITIMRNHDHDEMKMIQARRGKRPVVAVFARMT